MVLERAVILIFVDIDLLELISVIVTGFRLFEDDVGHMLLIREVCTPDPDLKLPVDLIRLLQQVDICLYPTGPDTLFFKEHILILGEELYIFLIHLQDRCTVLIT